MHSNVLKRNVLKFLVVVIGLLWSGATLRGQQQVCVASPDCERNASGDAAGGAANPANAAPQEIGLTSDNQWHIDFSPYLWFAGMHGTVGVANRQASVHVSAGDLLSNLNVGLMAFTEVRRNRLLFPVDMVWVRLSDSSALPVPTSQAVSANIRIGQFILTPKVGVRLIGVEGKFSFDALAGFRYWHQGQNFQFNPSPLGLNLTTSQSWADPVVGGRMQLAISPNAFVSVAGDAGGFGINAKIDYQVVGLLGYRFKPRWTAQVGYRYLDVDYRRGTIFDVAQAGVIAGVTFAIK